MLNANLAHASHKNDSETPRAINTFSAVGFIRRISRPTSKYARFPGEHELWPFFKFSKFIFSTTAHMDYPTQNRVIKYHPHCIEPQPFLNPFLDIFIPALFSAVSNSSMRTLCFPPTGGVGINPRLLFKQKKLSTAVTLAPENLSFSPSVTQRGFNHTGHAFSTLISISLQWRVYPPRAHPSRFSR
ncbi:hypothetical protein ARMGADRAFT_1159344 [Armillaria gallica]|uniref:Uncharacterized protein n=1 Tax=Armillaria gallica TaxID=47427 RepID=A0A2H3ETJ0_ARMGA|nr:hypothetical protein ARMGADRAFT_1159344 [Armillaria gallica]